MMKIIATNIGERKKIIWKNKTITTGIYKYPTEKPIFLDIKDVDGDNVIDRKNHGGIEQAVYAYGFQHYTYWKNLYPNLDWNYGMFGENLTVDNLDETHIFVGDVFRVGDAIIEVTKSRQPCYKLGVRFNNMKIVKQFWNTNMCGVYFKIIQTGKVHVNDLFELLKTNSKNPTIADVYNEKKG